MKTCLVGILIGKDYQEFWGAHVAQSWHEYAAKCGYGLCTIQKEIRPRPTRGASWQKLLLWGHPALINYDRLIYLDYDVLPLRAAPPVPDGLGLGCVSWAGSMARDPYMAAGMRRFWASATCPWIAGLPDKSWIGIQRFNGVAEPIEDCINGGVLVIDEASGPALRELWDCGIDTPYSSHEQTALTLHFARDHPELRYDLNRRFNVWVSMETWARYNWLTSLGFNRDTLERYIDFIEAMVLDNWFLHFLGCRSLLPLARAADTLKRWTVRFEDDGYTIVPLAEAAA